MSVSILAAAKKNDDGTFDAETSLTFYNSSGAMMFTSHQRTVKSGFKSREAATDAAKTWLHENVLPVFDKLPKAKP